MPTVYLLLFVVLSIDGWVLPAGVNSQVMHVDGGIPVTLQEMIWLLSCETFEFRGVTETNKYPVKESYKNLRGKK